MSATAIRYLYRRNRKGITAKLDDDLLKYYCNEDTFLMQVCYPVLRSPEPKIFFRLWLRGAVNPYNQVWFRIRIYLLHNKYKNWIRTCIKPTLILKVSGPDLIRTHELKLFLHSGTRNISVPYIFSSIGTLYFIVFLIKNKSDRVYLNRILQTFPGRQH